MIDFITGLGNIAREANMNNAERDAFEHYSKSLKFKEGHFPQDLERNVIAAFSKVVIRKDLFAKYVFEIMPLSLSGDTDSDGENGIQ